MRLLLLAAFVLLAGCAGLQNPFKRGLQDGDTPAAVEQVEPGAADLADTDDTDADATDPAPVAEPSVVGEPEAAVAPERPDANAIVRAQCLAKNGNFSRTKAGAFVCVTRTGDSGKVCSAAGQCEGACLARSGTCSPVVPLIGCNDIVTNNGNMATVCID